MKPVPTAKRIFRILTLFAPSWIAWYTAAFARHPGELERTLTHALGPLWVLVGAAVIVRLCTAASDDRPILERIDVLTARGSALAWTATFAFGLAVVLGYASLAVVGMLGIGLLNVAVLLALVVVGGRDPLRIAAFTRTFVPQTAAEGDALREEIHAVNPRIPIGFRLFVTGRIGQRFATSRHVLDSVDGGGEVLLESEVGPAVRGEHDPEPLVAWLEDVFGLCRSPRHEIAGPKLSVTPGARAVENAKALRDRGAGPSPTRSVRHLPSEGYFDLREYKEGDDVRRIHWVRSLASRELVVRLPDEIPPDRPRVRLVLDTFYPESFVNTSDAPGETLDALVGVWLAIARSLATSGAQVTLVTAVPDQKAPVRQPFHDRAGSEAQKLGARVAWQTDTPVETLLTDEATFIVSRGILSEPPGARNLRWIVVVPEVSRPKLAFAPVTTYPHPFGSSENRWTKIRDVDHELARARGDHARAMLAFGTLATRPPPGSFAAYALPNGTFRLEAIQ